MIQLPRDATAHASTQFLSLFQLAFNETHEGFKPINLPLTLHSQLEQGCLI